MKLVIRQYLASLKERGELDALLPDLLSQMGLEVFLKPGVGSRQFGVDVAAFGKLTSESESTVYLFSIKSGDLDRKDWDSGNPQDLRPSINEILDVFIPTRIPAEYKDKPVEICLCFGGEVKEEVRSNVSMFLSKLKTGGLNFSEWNGDRLADLVEQHMLREELLPNNCRGLLRKSLAMIDEPEVSFKHFSQLAINLTCTDDKRPKDILTGIRQIYLCLWILYSWCRDEDNLESAYLSAEFTMLNAWEAAKFAFGKNNKIAVFTLTTLDSILRLNLQISNQYIDEKIIPHCNHLYALSHAIKPSCATDVNLKLFDILGRLALTGCWSYWYLSQVSDENIEGSRFFSEAVTKYQDSIKQLIVNNPILFTPYKDEQAIDVVLTLWFLSLDQKHWRDIHYWLSDMSLEIYQMFKSNDKYPTTIQSYAELIEHPIDKTDDYRKSVTKGSILYPYISAFSAIMGFIEPYEIVKRIKEDFLSHCNFQVYFFDESSEEHFYRFDKIHGATLSDVCVTEAPDELIHQLVSECDQSNKVYDMTAFKYSFWPIILTGCRHYRLPVPMHFIIDIFKQRKEHGVESGKEAKEP
ncbi:hypothetical protein [Photobacterium damselae]|uniref:hypothetical protein n=1 Tax=Photobacterium damselae TaxID=38293 RepID=UPI00109B979B|nr:hypothetical protein [Photobacterium damselae]TGZ33302.1 hypothetical protein EQ875_03297 [Photobacterium damselae subsp. damselae]TLS79955.1 hypothetical protein FD721_02575 [Photobacterium damselae subsp. damselae]TLS85811.1 hypothetical protein FD720_14210 [Photobacterium damselae subsp. damselae]